MRKVNVIPYMLDQLRRNGHNIDVIPNPILSCRGIPVTDAERKIKPNYGFVSYGRDYVSLLSEPLARSEPVVQKETYSCGHFLVYGEQKKLLNVGKSEACAGSLDECFNNATSIITINAVGNENEKLFLPLYTVISEDQRTVTDLWQNTVEGFPSKLIKLKDDAIGILKLEEGMSLENAVDNVAKFFAAQ